MESGNACSILTRPPFGIVCRAMSKLPDITDADAVARIIERNATQLLVSDQFKNLVLQNIRQFPDEVRVRLYELMRKKSMDFTG